MICPPCARAADEIAELINTFKFPGMNQHDPAICCDHGRAGCGCQHGQRHSHTGTASTP